ncbi:hypothetical protein IPdc08_00750 [archaeon]|nr:hypothetical protein IPdc08_00750 [archaeon]
MGYDNPALAYAIIKLVEQFSERPYYLGKIRFNKLIYKIYRKLKDEKNIDLQLPNYWYKFGNATIMELLPDVTETVESIWEGKPREYLVVKSGVTKPELNGNRKRIDTVVREVFKDLGYRKLNRIIEDHYSFAPYEFQQPYLKLREAIETRANKITLDSLGIGKSNIYNLFYEMMSKFEDEEFAEILPEVLEWKSIISYLARHYPNENKEIQTVMEPFIYLISAALAVKTVENAEEKINEFKAWYIKQCELFDTFIQNYKKEFYIKYYQSDTHILSFVKEINAQVVKGL